MFDRIEYQFYVLAIESTFSLYLLAYYYAWIMSMVSGFLLPIAYFDRPEKGTKDTALRRLLLAFSLLLFVFGTLSSVTLPAILQTFQRGANLPLQDLNWPTWHWITGLSFITGITLHVFIRRQLSPLFNRLTLRMTKKTQSAREERTDVRHVRDLLPDTVEYDPEQYIDLSKGVFVGLDVERQPQYIPLADMQKQHMDILGTTGAGKGVASGLILYQLIQADEGVFVLDPKNDEWAPHLLKYACEKAGKPFHLIDLNQATPQLDLLANATPEQIEELLVAGFSFAEKGDIADFYRIDDRKAARKAPKLANEEERKTFTGLFNSAHVEGLKDTVKAFYGKMEELSEVESINAPNGLNMQSIFDEGGCCYIIGSLRNAKIIMAQKMILIRLFQLAEMRDRVNSTPKPIAIFLDELKYHISKAAMEGLGAARDKGIHMLLAHQSVADLRDCPADLNSDAVVGAVVENTKFKLVYKLQDPETAEWVAKMSGTILVDDETRSVETDATLSEIVDTKRTLRQAERYFVDTNMLLNLPPFVSYIFTATDVPKPSLISPIKVKKSNLKIFDDQKKKEEITPASQPVETQELAHSSFILENESISETIEESGEEQELKNNKEEESPEERDQTLDDNMEDREPPSEQQEPSSLSHTFDLEPQESPNEEKPPLSDDINDPVEAHTLEITSSQTVTECIDDDHTLDIDNASTSSSSLKQPDQPKIENKANDADCQASLDVLRNS
ncbi:type IV secretory system conjugative DNA transfer family protein [uncultured Vibrio sp.]|uniref:type IV secretory system conjugative DNA transfer family protein n=1 Tax=uncultured Vibrio sp. TaxID=114054 RepID=UPI00260179E3|nr:type IV secretion system DNA-binding domain-containing protein [uncultured Vibrio sp.]